MLLTSTAADQTRRCCKHCGLSQPAYRADTDFCCAGCETAYGILRAISLEDFYTYRNQACFAPPKPVSASGHTFLYLDDSEYQEKFCRSIEHDLKEVRLLVEGLHCAGCIWLLESLPRVFKGMVNSRLNLSDCLLELTLKPAEVRLSEVAGFLDKLGYRISPYPEEVQSRALSRDSLLRLGLAIVCAMNVQMVAVSLYQGSVSGIPDQYASLFAVTSLFLTLPVIFYSAWPLLLSAGYSVVLRRATLDVPLALGIGIGFVYSLWATFYEPTKVYFDTICSLVALILSGRVLQEFALSKARRRTRRALELLPQFGHVLKEQTLLEIPAEYLKVGDQIRVLPGERLPVDAVITAGQSLIDESLLTGESSPVPKDKGDQLYAGTLNIQADISLRVTSTRSTSRVGKILRELSSGAKPALHQFVDRSSRYIVYGVVFLSLGTFLWWLSAGPLAALDHAIALLIVTCPCALALGVPLAFALAVGKAARNGVIIKSEEVFERLRMVDAIVFDKTGTLTRGELSFRSIEISDCFRNRTQDVESVLAALSSAASSHPISRAILEMYSSAKPKTLECLRYYPGCGIEAVGRPNERWQLGSPSWTGSRIESRAAGSINVTLTLNSNHVATLHFADQLRPESAEVVAQLAKRFPVYLLSGDSNEISGEVANLVGIPESHCRGGMSPEQKLRFIESLGKKVLMIGDGFNDALAMQASHVSIGMQGSLATALESSDIFITSDRLNNVLQTLELSRTLFSLLAALLGFSVLYNLLSALLAFLGYIHPLAAAILMPISSLLSVSLALFWIGRWKWR